MFIGDGMTTNMITAARLIAHLLFTVVGQSSFVFTGFIEGDSPINLRGHIDKGRLLCVLGESICFYQDKGSVPVTAAEYFKIEEPKLEKWDFTWFEGNSFLLLRFLNLKVFRCSDRNTALILAVALLGDGERKVFVWLSNSSLGTIDGGVYFEADIEVLTR
jgi:hypothetical protein